MEPAYALEDRVRQAAAAGVAADNLPIYQPAGSGKAVLLIHGFRSTPWQMARLADAFSKQQYTTYAPLLPGHGTTPENLAAATRQDWEAEVLGAYRALAKAHPTVAVVGLSMGGVLALRTAEQEQPAAVVSVNAPVWLRDRAAEFAYLLKHAKPYTARPIEGNDTLHYYERIPTAAVAELDALMDTAYRQLPRIRSPVLVIQSRDDETVFPESGAAIYRRLQTEKELTWREGGTHVIAREPDVVERIAGYVARR
jgi:carboxylesterase